MGLRHRLPFRSAPGALRLTLALTDIEDLFRPPALSPFSPEYQDHSGMAAIEYVAGLLNTRPPVHEVILTLSVPAGQATPDLAERTQAAAWRYCHARAVELEQDGRALRARSSRLFGLAFLALLVSVLAGRPLSNSDAVVLQVLGEALVLAAWVFLWFPMDMWFFGERYQRINGSVYRTLMDLTVIIEPRPEGGAAP